MISKLNGKIYQKCEITRLDTTDRKDSKICFFNGKLYSRYWAEIFFKSNEDFITQHLYFTTSDPIRENDYILINKVKIAKVECLDGILGYNHGPAFLWLRIDERKVEKIIASTDISLDLPRPSKNFIENYCKAEGFAEVLVEVDCRVDNKSTFKTIDENTIITQNVNILNKSIELKNQGLTNSGKFVKNGVVEVDKAFEYYMPSNETLISDLKLCLESKDEELFTKCVTQLANNYYTLYKSLE